MSAAASALPDDAFAWDVITQISALLAPIADTLGGAVLAAFEVAEDALAEHRQDREAACPTPV